jgi:hypothetical protein
MCTITVVYGPVPPQTLVWGLFSLLRAIIGAEKERSRVITFTVEAPVTSYEEAYARFIDFLHPHIYPEECRLSFAHDPVLCTAVTALCNHDPVRIQATHAERPTILINRTQVGPTGVFLEIG